MPSIAIVGTGANGAAIGADLAEAGHDVTFIEQWPAHVEAIREHGIRVETPEEQVSATVPVLHFCEVATLRRTFDVVLLLVKAYDTRWACELIKPHLADDGIAVGVQNGMSVDDMTDVLGAERTLGAVIEISSTMFEPGVVDRHSPRSRSWFAVGSLGPATVGREEEVATLLRHSGSVDVVSDIRSAKWMKLVINAAELVPSAILDLSIVEAGQHPGMKEVMLQAGYEAVDAAVAAGRSVVPIFGLTTVDPSNPHAFVDTLMDVLLEKYVLSHTLSTVLQDWIKSRRSEVDQINGRVVEELARAGRQAPVNQAVVEIAHRIERGEIKRSTDHVSVLRAALPDSV
ncbi:2-dehydropantoate 2-reductase [Mycolicibacterium sp. 050158]|uniref:ketopantoate reductase family protein n=1 Tax=Mycolicibacterium sp. 050158 TaxID=3090602 RepID=UPI00299D5C01|nr:2-dehydropantoate 2-reductase [Mycolicibacterium sp. 050158]MDX1891211.1 2-dehydropantoate 2-reductase [Mycolicibacterium sp. 050158]